MSGTDLEKEATQRLRDCQARKAEIESDLREGYFFTAPRRSREVTSQSSPQTKPRDQAELQISLGMEVAGDFATEILNNYTPEVIEWAQQKKGIDLTDDEWSEVAEDVNAQTTQIFDAIKSSNFYAAAAQAYDPDLALGTVGLLIDDLRASEPVMCLPIPLRELEINVGPYGEVDDRFIVRNTKHRHLPALLKGVEMPADLAKKVKEKPNERCRVSWGWWRLWDRDDDVYWQHVVLIGNKKVAESVLKGEGSCPLIVGRFKVDPTFPFGDGPTLQALPEYRRLDETEALKIESADFRIHPAFIYGDDGVINFSAGIEPGKGYAARPWGNGDPIRWLVPESDVRFAEFETGNIESRVKRLHYVDYPEQLGKTPPTAEQWIDEMVQTKRRIGTPGKVFFKEFAGGVFLRFKYLLEKRGKTQPIKINGKTVALTPYDPTEQAQEHQDVQVAGRILEMARTYFAQTAEILVDGPETLKNIKAKLRDKVVVLRDPEQLKEAVQQFAPVLAGGAGGPMPGAQ